MKNPTFAILLVFSVLLCLEVVVTAFHCGKGYYWTIVRVDDGQMGCVACKPGSFCPGNDDSSSCPGGTIAPFWGQVDCNVCPNRGVANMYNTACLLSDTPKNAKEIYVMIENFHSYPTYVTLTTDTQYFYTTIPFSTVSVAGFAATFLNDRPVSVFASWKSGAPDAKNSFTYEMGKNVTIPITQLSKVDEILYFSAKLIQVTGKPRAENVTFEMKLKF